jgi:hypothetical protein
VVKGVFIFSVGVCLLFFSGCYRDADSAIQFSHGKYVLHSNDLTVEIDPNIGGRITSFKLGDLDILLQKTANKENYGSTLWPSPQNWPWPPSSVLDRMAYASSIQGDTLYLTSYPDQLTGLKFSKSFYIDELKNALRIHYTIINVSNQALSVGPWEVTRVPSGGISFFPVDSLLQQPLSTLESTFTKRGVTWFKFNEALLTSDQKLFQGGRLGWLAHINNGLLFVKSFPDIKKNEVAPGQGEVEIFASEYHTYVELENHGMYSKLKPGESIHYPVTWYLKLLNPTMKAEMFNDDLVNSVNALVTQ